MRIEYRIILWVMMLCQMGAWAWMQIKAGKLSDRQYLFFCMMFIIGQTASAIECWYLKTWGTMVVQAYFFVFTLVGAIIRWWSMRRRGRS